MYAYSPRVASSSEAKAGVQQRVQQRPGPRVWLHKKKGGRRTGTVCSLRRTLKITYSEASISFRVALGGLFERLRFAGQVTSIQFYLRVFAENSRVSDMVVLFYMPQAKRQATVQQNKVCSVA